MLIISRSVVTKSFSNLLLIKTTYGSIVYCTYEQRREPLWTIKLTCVQPPPPLQFFLRGGGGCTQAKHVFDDVFVIRRIIRAEVTVTSQAEGRG